MIRFASRTFTGCGFVRAFFAAFLAQQACVGFAAPAATANHISATPPVTSCCDGTPDAGCQTLDPNTAAMDSCAQQCLQPAHLSNGTVFSTTSIIAAHGRVAVGDEIHFRPYTQRLGAAPPAFLSTPLIYHLQRLLN